LLIKIFPGKLIGIKHLINLTFSFAALIGLFVLSKKIFNKEIAYLATLLCLLNPFFFGHISINPKDTISCFALVWFTYYAYKYCINFEKKRLKFLILASVFMGVGVGTRLPFFAVPVPVIIAALIFIITRNNYDYVYGRNDDARRTV
jgi:4-amino-4-deoxy-L-arabinose transferase-like glycosyltransferase